MEASNFIQTLSKGLAIDQRQSRAALEILLGFIVQQASADAAKKLLTALPWIHSLLGGERIPPMSISQINLTSSQSRLQPMAFDPPPHGLGLVGALKEIGITHDQSYVIVMRVLDLIARSAGETLALEILREVPDLRPFDEIPAGSDSPPRDAETEEASQAWMV